MTKQEEIRLWLSGFLAITDSDGVSRGGFDDADKLLEYLVSQGVVLKVDRELPGRIFKDNQKYNDDYAEGYLGAQGDMLKADYVAVEPLIQDSVDHSLDPLWNKVMGNAVKDGQLTEDEGEHFIEKYDAGLNPDSTEPTFKEG